MDAIFYLYVSLCYPNTILLYTPPLLPQIESAQ